MKVLPFNNTTKTGKMMEISDLPLFILGLNSLQDFGSLDLNLNLTLKVTPWRSLPPLSIILSMQAAAHYSRMSNTFFHPVRSGKIPSTFTLHTTKLQK